MRTILDTPPIPRIVPDGVFDAFSWCPSRALEWRAPDRWSMSGALTAENPAGMVFVMKKDLPFLPRALARLHAPALGLREEWALAPYGIDDATDELYARAVSPGDVLWLAADSLAGLFWGLHDWAHFHSHGPFIERAWTELQCDATALAWLWLNRRAIGLDVARWIALHAEALHIGEARFAAEGVTVATPRMDAEAIQSWVTPGAP